MNRILIITFLAGLMTACGVAERTVPHSSSTPRSSGHSSGSPEKHSDSSGSNEPVSPPLAVSVSKYREVEVSLEQAYRDWQGTPYRLGGTSSNGIDCSALMQHIFDQYFGINIPRNTKRQLYAGSSVRRKSLKTGDLVFFKTGRKTLHVGVIVEDDEFLHASTSEGVTISSLDEYYWKSRYMTARRIL